MQNQNQSFRTSSINLAAFLLANGYALLGKESDPLDSRRIVFILKDRFKNPEIINNFLLGEGGNVDVHIFLEAQKRLKSLLFERSL